SENELFAVCGLHKKGYSLEYQLSELGAEYIETVETAPDYKLYKLGTSPVKPGLVKGEKNSGEKIEVDLYSISKNALGYFLDNVSSPLTIGTVELSDGRCVKGFLCEEYAVEDAEDITKLKKFA
nr:allophanate hydrolase [Butyrivibrio sp.]